MNIKKESDSESHNSEPLFFISDNKKALNKSVLQCRWPDLNRHEVAPGRF